MCPATDTIICALSWMSGCVPSVFRAITVPIVRTAVTHWPSSSCSSRAIVRRSSSRLAWMICVSRRFCASSASASRARFISVMSRMAEISPITASVPGSTSGAAASATSISRPSRVRRCVST